MYFLSPALLQTVISLIVFFTTLIVEFLQICFSLFSITIKIFSIIFLTFAVTLPHFQPGCGWVNARGFQFLFRCNSVQVWSCFMANHLKTYWLKIIIMYSYSAMAAQGRFCWYSQVQLSLVLSVFIQLSRG